MIKKETALIKKVGAKILTVRDRKVMLDADLAELYGVETRVLNQAVRRNRDRFPEDFAFRLTNQEVEVLRSQFVISKPTDRPLKKVTAGKRGGRRYPPYVFTEYGAIMAANVLNNPKAVEMSVFIVRAFVKMREQLSATVTLEKRLDEVEKLLLTHDSALRDLYQQIRPLLLPPEQPKKKGIGFGVKEPRAKYATGKGKRK